jgi:predicted DNA-binding transcriptional regulator AlpA
MKGNGRTNDSLTCEHELLTPKRVARELAVSEAWVRDHTSGRRHPYLPHIRLGDRRGQLRFRRSDIDAFLQLNARGAMMRKEV